MPEEEAGGPKLGTYTGSYGSSNDKCVFELALLEDQAATIDCKPEVSFSKGGSHAWHVEGTWEWDGDEEEEVAITITQDDAFGGPKVDRELSIPLEDDTLTFKFATQKAECVWTRPPPDESDKFELEMASMSAKQLMAKAKAAGLNAEGCIERGDLEELLRRGKQSGAIKCALAELAAAPTPKAPIAAVPAAKAPKAPAPAPVPAPVPVPVPAAAPALAPKDHPPKEEAPVAAAPAKEAMPIWPQQQAQVGTVPLTALNAETETKHIMDVKGFLDAQQAMAGVHHVSIPNGTWLDSAGPMPVSGDDLWKLYIPDPTRVIWEGADQQGRELAQDQVRRNGGVVFARRKHTKAMSNWPQQQAQVGTGALWHRAVNVEMETKNIMDVKGFLDAQHSKDGVHHVSIPNGSWLDSAGPMPGSGDDLWRLHIQDPSTVTWEGGDQKGREIAQDQVRQNGGAVFLKLKHMKLMATVRNAEAKFQDVKAFASAEARECWSINNDTMVELLDPQVAQQFAQQVGDPSTRVQIRIPKDHTERPGVMGFVSRKHLFPITERPCPLVAPATAEVAPAAAEVVSAAAAGSANGIPVYTLEQLTEKHIWEQFDLKATEREQYLADSVFEEVFGMSKEAWAKVPKWKKDNLKKQKNLF